MLSRHHGFRFALLVAPAMLTAACATGLANLGSVDESASASSSGTGASPGSGGAAGAGGSLAFDGGVGSGGVQCSPEAKLIYTLCSDTAGHETLYTFDPVTHAFGKIGPVMCPNVGSAFIIGMAIDRNGTAWTLSNDFKLFRIDTSDAHCTATSFQLPGSTNGGGIAFVADSPGSTSETLYVSTFGFTGIPPVGVKGLITVDPQTLQITSIGSIAPDPDPTLEDSPSLMGTGDARLFGILAGSTLMQLDPSNAHVLSSVPLPSVANKGYAPVFWGGDMWVFGNPPGVDGSVVLRYDLTTNAWTTVVPDTGAGFLVVGAGVSTCAPLTTTQ